MFNLITVIFSIILVLVMAIAGVYYAGDAFSQKTTETEYTAIVNSANQIKAAMEIYRSKKGMYPTAASTTDLLTLLRTEGYLNTIPGGDWDIANLVIQRPIDDAQTCARMNTLAGHDVSLAADGCPPCDDAAFALWPACQVP